MTVEAVNAGSVTVSGVGIASVAIPADVSGLKAGDSVTLGIRPHDLSAGTAGTIVGEVGLVERLGNETNVSIKLQSGISWLVVLDGDHHLKIGQGLSLSFEPNRAAIFGADGIARHPD